MNANTSPAMLVGPILLIAAQLFLIVQLLRFIFAQRALQKELRKTGDELDRINSDLSKRIAAHKQTVRGEHHERSA